MEKELKNLIENTIFRNDTIELVNYNHVALGLFLFFVGIIGVLFNYKNFLITMMSVELMYLGIIVLFIITSIITYEPTGQIYALIFLVIAASESAIGLGILVVLYRFGKTIDFEAYQELRG